jgi:tetratricopeptide (TPR) repeat protein/HEAT repeat protein
MIQVVPKSIVTRSVEAFRRVRWLGTTAAWSRGAWLALWLGVALPIAVPAPPAAAQFSPSGRKRHTGKARPSSGSRSSSATRAGPGSRTRLAKPPDPSALIERYTAIVLAQPSAPFPLQKLAELYRARDGNLEQLIKDFEQRVDGKHQTALVALGGIYRQAGQPDRARGAFEKAIALEPGDAQARLALARLLEDQGDKAQAWARYSEALELLHDAADVEQTLRTLIGLSLDLGRWDDAERLQKKLVERTKGSFFVRAELGRELMLRGEYARAARAFERVAGAASGDNRVLVPVLRDWGKALAKTGQRERALAQLRRALRLSGAQGGVRREIYEIIAEVYRADNRLSQLIEELKADPVRDAQKSVLLGGLYEETGHIDQAMSAYRDALRRNARDVDTRLKLIKLLQISGQLDEALQQHEALVRAAPRNPDYVLQLAEALIARGNRAAALRQIRRLETQSVDDEDILSAIVDFYERVGENASAVALLERLAVAGSRDPRHLIELGNRFWQQGDKERANKTWKRLETVISDRARAQFTLGETYLEHDLVTEALEALAKANELAPNQTQYMRALALALERAASNASGSRDRGPYQERALVLWQQILKAPNALAQAGREARQHIVTLWSLNGTLAKRLDVLERQLRAQSPDLEAGRLLAEAQLKLRRFAAAERTLSRIVELAPGDVESLAQLERALSLGHKLKAAIAVLERLVAADPQRAREYYERMGRHAAELYEDDLAIRCAVHAVELSPDDADGYRKLGEMYLRRQDTERAISAFRSAIRKNDRLFVVYLQLAQLLVEHGEDLEADRLLRAVVRSAPDEELVVQAARLSMQINVGRGTLESLEKELLPVALGNPGRPVYRRLLVDVYGALAFPLIHEATGADTDRAAEATRKLAAIGERAVKPLLDALGDERAAQQRVAVELLGHIENRSAGPALFAYATGPADPELRARAMMALGALADPALLPRLAQLLAPKGEPRSDESDPVMLAAAWSAARVRSSRVAPLLGTLLRSQAPSICALAALGLGHLADRSAATRLRALLDDPTAGAVARAAAAFSLGQLNATGSADVLARSAAAADETLRAQAIIALARLHSESAPPAVAEALFSPDPAVRDAAVEAALIWSTGEYRGRDPLRLPDAGLDVRALLALSYEGVSHDATERARALIALEPAFQASSLAAVQSSPERAQVVADMLLGRSSEPGFGPFTAHLEQADPSVRAQAQHAAEQLAASLVESFVALAHHPAAEVRTRAIRLLAVRPEPVAREAVASALGDSDPNVQQTALSSLEPAHREASQARVIELVDKSADWTLRARAAEALGRIAAETADRQALGALTRAAESDAVALVREEAARALLKVDRASAEPVLRRLARTDPEPKVRHTVAALLK